MEVLKSESQLLKSCPTHSKFQLQFSSSQKNEGERTFYCAMCLINQEDIKTRSLLSIEETIHQSNHLPITNWPFGIQQSQLEYLTRSDSLDKKQQIQTQLEEFYEELESSIIQSLRRSKKIQLVLLEECTELKTDLIEFYNTRFKRSELVNIFSNSKLEENDYKKFLKSIEESKNEDLQELSLRIEKIQLIEREFQSNSRTKIVQCLLKEIISKIDIFSKLNQTTNCKSADQKDTSLRFDVIGSDNKEDHKLVNDILEDAYIALNSKQLTQLSASYNEISHNIQNCIQGILENIGSQKITDDTEKLLNLVERISQVCFQIEEVYRLEMRRYEEKELTDENLSRLLAAHTRCMFNDLTQTQKDLLKQCYQNVNCFYESENYLTKIVDDFKSRVPKAWQKNPTLTTQNTVALNHRDDNTDPSFNNQKLKNTSFFGTPQFGGSASLFDDSKSTHGNEKQITRSRSENQQVCYSSKSNANLNTNVVNSTYQIEAERVSKMTQSHFPSKRI